MLSAVSSGGLLGGCSALKPRIPVQVMIRNTTETRRNLELEVELPEKSETVLKQTIPVIPLQDPDAYQITLDIGEFKQGTKLNVKYRDEDFFDSEPVMLDCAEGTTKTISLRMTENAIDLGSGC